MNFGSLNEFLEYSMNKENLKMDLKEKNPTGGPNPARGHGGCGLVACFTRQVTRPGWAAFGGPI
jgi:hypothetical protein